MEFLSQLYDFMFAPAGTFDSGSDLHNASNDTNFCDDGPTIIDDEPMVINPASGLLMTDGIGGIDIMGNPYGVDFNHHDDFTCGNDSDMFSHDCGSTFDYGACSFDSSSMFDNSSSSIDTGSLFD